MTEVPLRPARVLALRGPHLAHALAVGVRPVAAAAYYASDPPFHPAIAPAEQARVEALYFPGDELSFERIAALRPDLIVGYDFFLEDDYRRASQIAPTVATEFPYGGDWREELLLVAEALGRRDRARELLAELDGAIAAARDRLGGAGLTVSAVRIRPDAIRVYNDQVFGGWLLDQLGFAPSSGLPTSAFADGVRQADISLERLGAVDGDVLFVAEDVRLDGEEAAQARRDAQRLPLWERLPAVRAGRVHLVNAQMWEDGTLQGARQLLGEFERAVGTSP